MRQHADLFTGAHQDQWESSVIRTEQTIEPATKDQREPQRCSFMIPSCDASHPQESR